MSPLTSKRPPAPSPAAPAPRLAAVPTTPRRLHLIRASSPGQAQRDTPEAQRIDLRRLAEYLPCDDVGWIEYGALGLSGALPLAERRDLQEVARRAAAHEFTELACWDISRLTRSLSVMDRATIADLVIQAQAVIIEASGHTLDPSTPVGEMEWFMRSRQYAEELLWIGKRTGAGKARRALEGYFIGRAPYGRRWLVKEKRWEYVEEERTVYRRIFDLVIEGVSLSEIARILEAEGIPTPNEGDTRREGRSLHGKKPRPWSAGAVVRLARAKNAYGEITSNGIPHTGCLAIVDRATWEKAQKMIRGNGRAGRPTLDPGIALVRGLARCAACGSPMWVGSSRSRGETFRYYTCASYRTASPADRSPDCRKCHALKTVDDDAWAATLDWLAARVAPKTGKAAPQITERDAKRALAELDRREQKTIELGQYARDPSIAQRQLLKIREEAEAIRVALEGARAAAREPEERQIAAERRATLLHQARGAVTPAKRRELLVAAFRPGDVRVLGDGSTEIRASE